MDIFDGIHPKLDSLLFPILINNSSKSVHHVLVPLPIINLSCFPLEFSSTVFHPFTKISYVYVSILISILSLTVFQVIAPLSFVGVSRTIVKIVSLSILFISHPISIIFVSVAILVNSLSFFKPINQLPIIKIPVLILK